MKLNQKPRSLAFELTKLVHGEGGREARTRNQGLFARGGGKSNVPHRHPGTPAILTDGAIPGCGADAQVRPGALKKEAHRLVEAREGSGVDGQKGHRVAQP